MCIGNPTQHNAGVECKQGSVRVQQGKAKRIQRTHADIRTVEKQAPIVAVKSQNIFIGK